MTCRTTNPFDALRDILIENKEEGEDKTIRTYLQRCKNTKKIKKQDINDISIEELSYETSAFTKEVIIESEEKKEVSLLHCKECDYKDKHFVDLMKDVDR